MRLTIFSMLRRLLTTWLIISILGYGMAMAADLHIELSPDQSHAISDHHPYQPNDVDDNAGCDHCCHGVLHLIGLKSSENLLLPIDSDPAQTVYAISSSSFSPNPLLRPPIHI
ncbi:MAG: hypothetical protein KZQ90_05740 [Candidatus Thiodiazotropha sp. (ex Codakia rugifera)]|nr:hypothetical protein [Candidatus Thiodiazotropha sp. (ex Codakia rugifera)]